MKIKDVMTKDVHIVSPDCTIQDAARKMKEMDIGVLPICDGNKILGTITDRDIVLKVVADGLEVAKATVSDAMSGPVVFCFEDQDVEDAARIMEVKLIRRLVVINREKKLVGITSLGDVAVRTGREDLAGEILEKVAEQVGRNESAA